MTENTDQTTAGARTQRMQEIEGLMNAHRQQWTSIDRAVLVELKNEYWHLKRQAEQEAAKDEELCPECGNDVHACRHNFGLTGRGEPSTTWENAVLGPHFYGDSK